MTRGRKQKKRDRRTKENGRRELVRIMNEELERPLTGHSCDRAPAAAAALSISSLFKNEDLQEIANVLGITELDDSHALLAAIALGKFDIIKRLLKTGYSLESTNEDGLTPMLWAVKLKKVEVTDFLLRRGANINATDSEDNNALLLALQTNIWDQDTFLDFWNLIKDTSISLNHTNKTGNCALHYMVKRQWDSVLEVILTNTKLNVNLLTNKHVSPLMMACSRHQEKTFSILVKHKSDIFIEDERGCTALCYAIAFFMQKNLSMPNAIITKLIDLHLNTGNDKSLEGYLHRRLELLANPSQAGFTQTISTIISHIISFFSQFIAHGLDTLVASDVFKKLKMAIDRNIENMDYCLCLFEMISDIVKNHNKNVNNIDKNKFASIFNESDLLPLMLRFIKRYCPSSLKLKDLYTILQPLVHFSNNSVIKCWLQRNFKTLAYSCNSILQISNPTGQLYSNEIHSQRQKVICDEFKSLMNHLKGTDNSPKKSNNLKSRSIGIEESVKKLIINDIRVKNGTAIVSGKSEENLSVLDADNSQTNVLHPIDEEKCLVQDKNTNGGDMCKISFSSESCWTVNSPINDFSDENVKLVYPKWKEEFKEGCALFGISVEKMEENTDESVWEMEDIAGDMNLKKITLTGENAIVTDDDRNRNRSQAQDGQQQSPEEDANNFETNLSNLDRLVKTMIEHYEQQWKRENATSYTNFINSGATEDADHLLRVVPELEKYYITKIRSSWCSLSCRLQEKWVDNKEQVLDTMKQLHIYLTAIITELETKNQNSTSSKESEEVVIGEKPATAITLHTEEEKEIPETEIDWGQKRENDDNTCSEEIGSTVYYVDKENTSTSYTCSLSLCEVVESNTIDTNFYLNEYEIERTVQCEDYNSQLDCWLRNKYTSYSKESLLKVNQFTNTETDGRGLYLFNFFRRISPPPGFADKYFTAY